MYWFSVPVLPPLVHALNLLVFDLPWTVTNDGRQLVLIDDGAADLHFTGLSTCGSLIFRTACYAEAFRKEKRGLPRFSLKKVFNIL